MVSEIQYRQDMPPSGGYRKFNYARTFPKLVWRPGFVVAGVFGASVYGAFEAINKKKRAITEKFEDVDINNAMEPFLTAERDRYWLKLLKKNRDLEEEIMKDMPGWKTGTWYGEPVYFTLGNKWWDPTSIEVFAHSSPREERKDLIWRQHSEYSAPKFYDKWIPEIIAKLLW
uniref:NADH dehydrogenase [ubiquinone] 1 alpha subcomplex subunit 13 n=1 Tax=Heterorhabditis bacteriophora TaxID=37862 RepID=A0A1I7XGH7_HETBA